MVSAELFKNELKIQKIRTEAPYFPAFILADPLLLPAGRVLSPADRAQREVRQHQLWS